MALPRSVKDFFQEIERMEEEIAMYESNVEMNIQKCMDTQRSIEEVKMLQDKARFVIKCNETKWQKYREEMAEIAQSCFDNVKADICADKSEDYVGKNENIKETKVKSEDDVNTIFSKSKSDGVEAKLPALMNNYERIKIENNVRNMKSEM